MDTIVTVQISGRGALANIARLAVEARKKSSNEPPPRRGSPTSPGQPAIPPAPRPSPPAPQPSGHVALAAEILVAGKRRRGEMVDDAPEPTGLASKIIRAGRVRRGEIVSTPKLTGLALQIVEAGRKRRGEI